MVRHDGQTHRFVFLVPTNLFKREGRAINKRVNRSNDVAAGANADFDHAYNGRSLAVPSLLITSRGGADYLPLIWEPLSSAHLTADHTQ